MLSLILKLWRRCRQNWGGHFIEIIPIIEPLKREFYAELCRAERWSIRTLRDKIQGMLFERTVISKKPEITIRNDLETLRETGKQSTNLVLRDPYLLEFLGLEDSYSESELEKAILRDLEKFLIELGSDFTFVARQKRISIGGEDFYIDLLLFHRSLRRLVLIELKLGKFKAAYKGQVELYLRWLDKHERKEEEESPLGIILCAEKDHEQIELLELGKSDIHVAQYLTNPLEKILKNQLHLAVEKARNQRN
jgi:predicted nuclease of restriction endonuclease-like (RecB) superfamily